MAVERAVLRAARIEGMRIHRGRYLGGVTGFWRGMAEGRVLRAYEWAQVMQSGLVAAVVGFLSHPLVAELGRGIDFRLEPEWAVRCYRA